MTEVKLRVLQRHEEKIHRGLAELASGDYGIPESLGNVRWTPELLMTIWEQAGTGKPPTSGLEYKVGRSGGGFDALDFRFAPESERIDEKEPVDLSLSLNRRRNGPPIEIPIRTPDRNSHSGVRGGDVVRLRKSPGDALPSDHCKNLGHIHVHR